jgi:type VI secretion system protein ImpJ
MPDKLARVRWYVGQTLLPEHLVAQEEAELAAQRVRARLDGLPGWGLVRLAWNDAQLAGGVLAVTGLTLVLAGGDLVDVPGNARVSPLDLNALARPCVTVYANLRGGTLDGAGVPLYADDPPTVARVLRRLELSADAPLDGALASMPLCVLEKDGARGWRPAAAPLPALLQVGVGNPFQTLLVGRFESILMVLESQLLLRLGGGEAGQPLAQSQTRQLLARVQTVLARLGDLDQGISAHPFALYRSLRELYFELCVFVEVNAASPPPYVHDDPASCFAGLASLFQERLAPATTRVTEQRFVRDGGVFLLSPVPDGARHAAEVYLLVRGGAVDPAAVEALKLAGRARLRTIHKLVLQGVAIRHLPEPPFPHAFAHDVAFFLLGKNAEWELALREGSLAFHAHPGLERAQVSLFWR